MLLPRFVRRKHQGLARHLAEGFALERFFRPEVGRAYGFVGAGTGLPLLPGVGSALGYASVR